MFGRSRRRSSSHGFDMPGFDRQVLLECGTGSSIANWPNQGIAAGGPEDQHGQVSSDHPHTEELGKTYQGFFGLAGGGLKKIWALRKGFQVSMRRLRGRAC